MVGGAYYISMNIHEGRVKFKVHTKTCNSMLQTSRQQGTIKRKLYTGIYNIITQLLAYISVQQIVILDTFASLDVRCKNYRTMNQAFR